MKISNKQMFYSATGGERSGSHKQSNYQPVKSFGDLHRYQNSHVKVYGTKLEDGKVITDSNVYFIGKLKKQSKFVTPRGVTINTFYYIEGVQIVNGENTATTCVVGITDYNFDIRKVHIEKNELYKIQVKETLGL